MDTITDLYISAHSDCRPPPDPGRGDGDLALGYRWGERDPVSDSGPIEATPASALAVLDLKIQPGAEPTGENEIAVDGPALTGTSHLAVLAAFGCGLALAEGHFLFVGIFAAASAAMVIEAMRRSRRESGAKNRPPKGKGGQGSEV